MTKRRDEHGSAYSTSTASHDDNDKDADWLCCACNMDLHSET